MNVFPIMTHVKVDGLPFSSLTEMCYYCTKSVSSYVWIYFCMWEESHWVLLRYLNSVYKIFIYECKAFNIDINGNSAWDLVVKINICWLLTMSSPFEVTACSLGWSWISYFPSNWTCVMHDWECAGSHISISPNHCFDFSKHIPFVSEGFCLN